MEKYAIGGALKTFIFFCVIAIVNRPIAHYQSYFRCLTNPDEYECCWTCILSPLTLKADVDAFL